MIKRLILILALGATLVACGPARTGSPGASLAPIDSPAPIESMPTESMPVASPSS